MFIEGLSTKNNMTDFLNAQWENLVMANFAVDQDILLPYLPKGVELDFYENKTYVSLVGFMFRNTKIFNIPIPYLGTFEEINLRFYVKRSDKNEVKRGVVFINETIPYKTVAWVANRLYKEHYISIPTRHHWNINNTNKQIEYEWKVNKSWNSIQINALSENQPMPTGSIEEFIFEHYYGYTKINNALSQEYKINHPRWKINEVLDYEIKCDFEKMYGVNFEFLNNVTPDSVILAEGSPVSVKWKRNRF